jgi:hypothetical protein
MRALPWRERFDACVMLGGSFGIFSDETENERVLSAVAGALKPGAYFVLDAANRDRIVCEHRPERRQTGSDFDRCVKSEFDPVAGINRTQERWLVDGRWRERSHQRRLYTATELDRMLRQSGLVPTGFWGGYDGSRFTTGSSRILIVTQKQSCVSTGSLDQPESLA